VPRDFRTDPPRLLGSRDPATGETFFPPRALAIDGSLRETEPVELSPEGTLHTFTSFMGTDYGQVDLPEGVRVQGVLGAGPHEIGARYVLQIVGEGEDARWRFTRA